VGKGVRITLLACPSLSAPSLVFAVLEGFLLVSDALVASLYRVATDQPVLQTRLLMPPLLHPIQLVPFAIRKLNLRSTLLHLPPRLHLNRHRHSH